MFRSRLLFGYLLVLGGCGSTEPSNLVSRNPEVTPGDTVPPAAPDSATGDSTPPPPVPDSVVPPPDTTTPDNPPINRTHAGIPFGPDQIPMDAYDRPEYSGGIYGGATREGVIASLDKARQTNARIFINLTGNESAFRDEKGFNAATWKRRVDRFRGIDFSPYIADGTLLGHIVLDEPNDKTNWNGHVIAPQVIEEMARYSKEIWPNLPTVTAVWPSYLKGYQYKYLDAVRVHYHIRFGSLEQFMIDHTRDAKALGLALISGLNLLNGGSGESKIPGHKEGKWAMSPREITVWGNAIMADPYICGFVLWQYQTAYLARPEIRAALADLKKKAEAHSRVACHRSG